jgi:O-antigen/teichoic acid export membrane protein
VDADGATPPAEFLRLSEAGKKADGVIASRWLPKSNVTAHQKWLRLLSSRVFNIAIRILLGLKYKDTQCGAKIFKAEAWQKILPNIGITRFAFDVDILFQLKRSKYHIIEEPTEWHDVAGSKVNILGSSLEMFLAILRMRLVYSPFKPLVRLYERTISKPVEFLLKDPLFRHTALLASAAMIGHVCNISFQIIVGHALSPTEYTLLATFLALFAIVQRPFGTIATAMNHFTSVLSQKGEQGKITRLVIKWAAITAIPAIFLATASLIFSPQIAAYFHLNRIEPIIVAALALPAICIAPVFNGTNGGMQRFGVSALAGSTGALFRVVSATVLVTTVFPAAGWALAGHVGAMYISVAIIASFLLPVLSKSPTDQLTTLPHLRGYLFWAFLINLSGGFLLTGDIVLARRYIPENTTFAYAATLSRIAIFLAASVVSAMFPKVSSSQGFRSKDKAVYLKALLYTGFFVFLATIICMIFPRPMLQLLYKVENPSIGLLHETRLMALVMACATFLSINQMLLLAQRRFKALAIVGICALLYISVIHVWHPSVYAIILVAGTANAIALLATTINILRSVPAANISTEQI